MQITESSAEGLRHTIKVVVPGTEIDAKVQDRLKELSRTVKIPGFRPGKVPLGMLNQRFGPSVAREVVETVLGDAVRQIVKDRGLRPAQEPSLEDITPYAPGQDLVFSLVMDVLPEIETGNFADIAIERPVAEVDDAALEVMLNSLAELRRRTEKVEEDRASETGDVLLLNFAGTVDGVAHEGMQADDVEMELGNNQFLPEFGQQLAGARAGEVRTVTLTFPADYPHQPVAGKEGVFAVTVRELRRSVRPPVDEELAKGFGLDSLEALHKSARDRLASEYKELSRRRAKRALFDKLAADQSFPLPQGLVDGEFETIWNRMLEERKEGRVAPEDENRSDDELKADYRAIAERRVRLGLLFNEVGRRNNIVVTEEELNRALISQMQRWGDRAREILELYRKHPELKERLRAPLFEDKVTDFLLELVQITDVPVSAEELRRDGEDEDSDAA